MRYADTLLAEGEVVVLRSRQHWLALFLDARWAVVLWAVGIALLVVVAALNLGRDVSQIISVVALVCLGIGLLIFLYQGWQWWAQDYMVTNRRLMKVTGIFNKRSSDSSLEKINDAILHQNVLGRILNYGDLDILTASESSLDDFRMLNGAKEFKRVMLNQKHALEMGMAYGRPPSPPLRASPVTMNGEPTRPQTPEPAPEPVRPAAVATEPASNDRPATAGADELDESLGITQTLARLADLRDRGAITPEEYETKKKELLGRL